MLSVSSRLTSCSRETSDINLQIKNVIDGHTEPWGAEVTAVEIKDITLPENMQRAMAKEAEAERERRAKDRRCRRRVPGGGEARRGGGYYRVAPGCTSAPHAPDYGRNCHREELHDHLPSTVYDDCAGGDFDDQARHKQQIVAVTKIDFFIDSNGFNVVI